MLFNVSKCKVMHAGRNNALQEYEMEGQTLEAVQQERDLGVIITKDMKASQQCRQAYSKANKMLGIINRTVDYKSREVLLKLYKSLVRPQLEFCTAVWSPHYKKDKELLERIQHRFTRMVPGLKQLPYDQRLEALNLWTLEEQRVRADLIEAYKIMNGLSAMPFESLFQLIANTRTRGHSVKLKKASTPNYDNISFPNEL